MAHYSYLRPSTLIILIVEALQFDHYVNPGTLIDDRYSLVCSPSLKAWNLFDQECQCMYLVVLDSILEFIASQRLSHSPMCSPMPSFMIHHAPSIFTLEFVTIWYGQGDYWSTQGGLAVKSYSDTCMHPYGLQGLMNFPHCIISMYHTYLQVVQ